MLDELTVSSNLLCAAIERYSAACLAIQRSYARGEKPHITIPQLALRMDAEVEVAASLGLKLRKATAAISWSKNHSSTSTTINSLPSELLAHIFHLVHQSQPCAKRNYDTGDAKAEPIYPAVLALVCSRWREVVSSIPGLWSHIDISTSTLLNRECLNGLMQLHVDRAGQLPLDLHIFDSHSHEITSDPGPIYEQVDQIAGHTCSLDLDVRHSFDYDIHCNILAGFLGKCIPGKLTQLTLTQYGDKYHFIKGYDHLESWEEHFDGMIVELANEQFEDIMSSISILRLHRIYPQWDSHAYYGLVELRLTGKSMRISESELADMIRSSPALRVLQFNLTINSLLPTGRRITPISLSNLEVLKLAGMTSGQTGILLGWLSPGSKPLQVAVTHTDWLGQGLQMPGRDTAPFFSRSYITRVLGRHLNFSHVQRLLDLCPNLQMLALDGATFEEPGHWEIIRLAPARQLQYLYLTYSMPDISAILALINYPGLSIKTFSFYRCIFRVGGCYIPENQTASHIEELARDHPGVRFIVQDTEGQNPVENWEVLSSYEISRGSVGD